jgi:pyruvate-formate lyase-activating enzyme
MLTIEDHRRDSAGLRYVYPVVSRRAGGVSVGVNLNVNNACNWACVYCQVEDLVRGGPPPVDVGLLEAELSGFLEKALHGDFMAREVPDGARRLMDVAFSGNGEPTSAPEFAEAVLRVRTVIERHGLAGRLPLRLITNGSLLHRPVVRRGIALIGGYAGEVWFKFDRAPAVEAAAVNGVTLDPARAIRNLAACAELAPTWVQTCWFAIDGQAPSAASREAYCAALNPLAGRLAGVHLYGLARPSLQPAAGRLSRLSEPELASFAAQIRETTGLVVTISP